MICVYSLPIPEKYGQGHETIYVYACHIVYYTVPGEYIYIYTCRIIYSCGVYKSTQRVTFDINDTPYIATCVFVFKIHLHGLCACVSFCSCILCNVIF